MRAGPCAADPVPSDKLVALGAFWLSPAGTTQSPGSPTVRRPPIGSSNVFITRLHVRYDAAHFPEDLMFQETADRDKYICDFDSHWDIDKIDNGQSIAPNGSPSLQNV
jgi:hypothetical protein